MKVPGLSIHSPEDLVGSPRVPPASSHSCGSQAPDWCFSWCWLSPYRKWAVLPNPRSWRADSGETDWEDLALFPSPPPRFVVQFHSSFKGFEKLWQGNQRSEWHSHSQGKQAAPILSPRAPGGTRPADPLIFALKNPLQTCLSKHNKFVFCEATIFMIICYSSHKKLIQV